MSVAVMVYVPACVVLQPLKETTPPDSVPEQPESTAPLERAKVRYERSLPKFCKTILRKLKIIAPAK